jgi:lysophospholipase L1-like esterase
MVPVIEIAPGIPSAAADSYQLGIYGRDCTSILGVLIDTTTGSEESGYDLLVIDGIGSSTTPAGGIDPTWYIPDVPSSVPGGTYNFEVYDYTTKALLFSGTAVIPAAPAVCSGKWVALGDSYSSGEGVPPFIQPGPATDPKDLCHRSYDAYSQVAPALGVSQNFWACSGATTDSFMFGQTLGGNSSEPSQIKRLGPQDSMVSLTMGGNDVGFASVMETCLTKSNCQKKLASSVQAKEATTAHRLKDLYTAILSAAPNAQVYVLAYPNFLAPGSQLSETCQLEGLEPAEADWIIQQVSNVDASIVNDINKVNASVPGSRLHYVPTFADFAGGEACSSTGEFVNGLNARHPEYSFHPNQAGQQMLASSLVDAVLGS